MRCRSRPTRGLSDVQVVRAPVALAMVKLLRLLPTAAAHAQLPRTLQGVANLLRNRLQRFRRGSLHMPSVVKAHSARQNCTGVSAVSRYLCNCRLEVLLSMCPLDVIRYLP